MTTQTLGGEALIRRYYDLVDANAVADMVALFQPEAIYSRPGYPDMAGHADITRFYAHQRKFRSGTHTLAAVLHDAGRVAVHGSFRGELRDGTAMQLRFADFFEIGGDGRFSRRDTYYFAPLG